MDELIERLIDFRQKTAQKVLCKLFDRFDDLFDSYNQRPEEMKDMTIEQYAANVAVAYADSLIEALNTFPDVETEMEDSEEETE